MDTLIAIAYNQSWPFIGVLVAIFTIWQARRHTPRRDLRYEIRVDGPLLGESVGKQLKNRVAIDDEKVHNPHLFVIKYINTGKTVNREDAYTIPVGVKFRGSAKIISVAASAAENPNLLHLVRIQQPTENSFTFDGVSLEKKENITFTFVIDNYEGVEEITGRAEGIPDVRPYIAVPVSQLDIIMAVFFIVIGVINFLLWATEPHPQSIQQFQGGFNSGIFMALVILLIANRKRKKK